MFSFGSRPGLILISRRLKSLSCFLKTLGISGSMWSTLMAWEHPREARIVGSEGPKEVCPCSVWCPLPPQKKELWNSWMYCLSWGSSPAPVTSPSSAAEAFTWLWWSHSSDAAESPCQDHGVCQPFAASVDAGTTPELLSSYYGKTAVKGPVTNTLLLIPIPCHFPACYWHDELIHLASSAPDRWPC